MRTRQEIGNMLENSGHYKETKTLEDLMSLVKIEVLLDIRDQNEKIIKLLEKLK